MRCNYLDLFEIDKMLNQPKCYVEYLKKTCMPSTFFSTIFFGHGSPMSAIESNSMTQKWQEIIRSISKPEAILVISAHWQTKGTKITGSSNPQIIHDFGGFPQELFDKQYPAMGNPILAREIAEKLDFEVDHEYGLDHGSWSVLAQIYPEADIPALQLSLDVTKTPQEHFELGQKLAYLREHNILIIGSGNIVHNLRLMDMSNQHQGSWAKEFDEISTHNLKTRNFKNLINYKQYGEIASKSINSGEHYLPLLYICGASNPRDKIEIFNNEIQLGAISMTSVKFG
jgi:4,5-DOPA dioxygenase extradiol